MHAAHALHHGAMDNPTSVHSPGSSCTVCPPSLCTRGSWNQHRLSAWIRTEPGSEPELISICWRLTVGSLSSNSCVRRPTGIGAWPAVGTQIRRPCSLTSSISACTCFYLSVHITCQAIRLHAPAAWGMHGHGSSFALSEGKNGRRAHCSALHFQLPMLLDLCVHSSSQLHERG
jgi:hypothetical protein